MTTETINTRASRKRILVVEDEPTVVMLIELTLNEYDLTIFDNASQAYTYIKQNKQEIDLILLDNMLPGNMSGLDLLLIIKEDPALQNIQVIMQSGDSNVFTDRVRKIADYLLQKPYKKSELLEAVKMVLGKVS